MAEESIRVAARRMIHAPLSTCALGVRRRRRLCRRLRLCRRRRLERLQLEDLCGGKEEEERRAAPSHSALRSAEQRLDECLLRSSPAGREPSRAERREEYCARGFAVRVK